jgi:uncharacterized membrane protein
MMLVITVVVVVVVVVQPMGGSNKVASISDVVVMLAEPFLLELQGLLQDTNCLFVLLFLPYEIVSRFTILIGKLELLVLFSVLEENKKGGVVVVVLLSLLLLLLLDIIMNIDGSQ